MTAGHGKSGLVSLNLRAAEHHAVQLGAGTGSPGLHGDNSQKGMLIRSRKPGSWISYPKYEVCRGINNARQLPAS